MNAKSKLTVKYAEGVIEMNTTFAKMMQNPLSEEYALLQRTRQDFPTFAIRHRQIKSKLVIPTTAFSALAKDILPAVKFDTSAFARSVLEQIDTSTLTALQEAVSVGALVGKDWSWMDDVQVENAEIDNQETPVREVSPEIRSQIAADITDVLSDPENMHTTSRNKYLDWVRERPENAMLFWQTLCQIIQTLFVVLLSHILAV